VNALAALLLCTLLGSGKVELRFAPVEGSQVRRTITIDQALAAKGANPRSTHHVLQTLDLYRKVGDGRPLLLQRRFEQIDWGPSRVPPLKGTSVVYTWVPEEAGYGKYYDALESSEAALRDLAEDLDLRALLPTGAVATGEAWSVPAAKLRDVLAPLGDLALNHEAVREFTGNLGEPRGECRLQLASVSELNGRSLATVELALKLENKVRASEPPTWSFEGRGTLVWDLGARRAASFALQGHQTLNSEVLRSSVSGTLAFTWKIEDPASSEQPPSPK